MIYSLKENTLVTLFRGNKEDDWINRRNNNHCEWKNGNLTAGAVKYCYGNLTERDINFGEDMSMVVVFRIRNI